MNEQSTGQEPSGNPAEESSPRTTNANAIVTKRKSRWLWWTLAVICILVIVLFIRRKDGGKNDAASPEPPPPNISASTAYRGDIGQFVDALGSVTPVATVNVYPQITGSVVAVHYNEGQMVRRGDTLVDLDPRPYQAQLTEAEGTLEHDKGVLSQAEIDLARYKDAAANKAIARQTYEDQQQVVIQDQGTVKNDQGQVQYAQVQLSYCHIVAPINGRMGLRLVDTGNTVFSGSSSALAVITQLQPITVVFNVAEDNLGKVHQEIEHRGALRVDAYDRAQLAKIATGKLLTLDNQIDTTTGTVRFRAQFDNAALTLYPNQFVNTRLLVNTIHDSTLVPSMAIQHNGVNAFVYRIVGGIAKIQPVREVTSEGDTTAVQGIQPGDTVATTGFDKLQDGTKVNVQNKPNAQGGGAQ